jgi:hypothetical protein
MKEVKINAKNSEGDSADKKVGVPNIKDKPLGVEAIADIIAKKGSTNDNAIVVQIDGKQEFTDLLVALKQKNVICESLDDEVILVTSVKGNPENKEIKNARDTKGTPNANGHWKNKNKGDDLWIPDWEYKPGKFNDEGKTWNEIGQHLQKEINKRRKEKHLPQDFVFEGVWFKNDIPDFRPFSFGEVTVNSYTSDRDANFELANTVMARKKKKPNGENYTADEIDVWMKEHDPRLTWHEDPNCHTMMKVPSVLHGNVSHTGGINAMNMKGNELYAKKINESEVFV